MEKPEASNLEAALHAAEIGIVPVPCKPLTKVPVVKWKEWQTVMPGKELIQEWFKDPRRNVAIITNGMLIFDCDDPAKADLVVEKCGETPSKLKTPSGGIHLRFRRRNGVAIGNEIKVKGMEIDIRTDNGLELIPPSVTADGSYEWLGEGLLPISGLPYGNIGWTRTRTRRKVVSTIVPELAEPPEIIKRGTAYVDTFDRKAVSGSNGHTALFVAALKIVTFVKNLGGGEADMWQLLLHFNATKCDPPWDPSDPRELAALRHKLEDAVRKNG